MKKKKIDQSAKIEKQEAINRSQNITNSIVNASMTIKALHSNNLDLQTVANELCDDILSLKDGGMREIKIMLMSQAQTLNAMFHHTVRQMTDMQMIDHLQVFADIAFRAQTQSRKTLAVLAEMNNPKRTTFIKQQNTAINQQVNNSTPEDFQISKKPGNELLEKHNEQRLDTRTTITPSAINPSMATVEIGGRENARRQGYQQDERL